MSDFKIQLEATTIESICNELDSIPEKYQKKFNSMHEALGVIREEYIELEQEIFFGEKEAKYAATARFNANHVSWTIESKSNEIYHENVRAEAIQLAAMCIRLIQELT